MKLRVDLRSDFSGLLPNKGPASKRPKTPAQSVRAFNPTCRQEPIRVSGKLAPKHVGRKGNRYANRSEEHTSELQSLRHLVCRLLLEKKTSSITSRATNITPPTP